MVLKVWFPSQASTQNCTGSHRWGLGPRNLCLNRPDGSHEHSEETSVLGHNNYFLVSYLFLNFRYFFLSKKGPISLIIKFGCHGKITYCRNDVILVWIKILEQSWYQIELHFDIQSTFYIMNFAYQMLKPLHSQNSKYCIFLDKNIDHIFLRYLVSLIEINYLNHIWICSST